jgi:hypothetical protein
MWLQIKNRLSNFSAKPSPEVWDRIAASLDESQKFASKLQHYEEVPPATVWNNINKALNTQEPFAPVVPISKSYKKVFALAAAAVVLAAIVFSGVLLNRQQPGSQQNISAATRQQPVATPDRTITPKRESQRTDETVRAFAAVSHSEDNTVSQKNHSANVTRLRRRLSPSHIENTMDMSFMPVNAERVQTVDEDIPLEKYMVYSDGEGTAIKLPKKLFDFFSCVKEEAECKMQMRQLQQQFASTSTTDFGGVMELVKKLADNQ